MYNPSDTDNIDYVLILSVSRPPKLLYKRENFTVALTVNRHISGTVLYMILQYLIH